MTGSSVTGPQRGIVPRAVEAIVQQAQEMRTGGWELTLSVSIVELYNEDLRDLLRPAEAPAPKSGTYKIVRQQGKMVVTGLSSVSIDTTDLQSARDQFQALLLQSASVRATARTDMNETSSRSHQIVMMDIAGVHSETGTVMQGTHACSLHITSISSYPVCFVQPVAVTAALDFIYIMMEQESLLMNMVFFF